MAVEIYNTEEKGRITGHRIACAIDINRRSSIELKDKGGRAARTYDAER
jgi:hypothetical protein